MRQENCYYKKRLGLGWAFFVFALSRSAHRQTHLRGKLDANGACDALFQRVLRLLNFCHSWEMLMLAYLRERLMNRIGAAPVVVTFADSPGEIECLMTAVDEIGIVIAAPSDPKSGTAYPWSAIAKVRPNG